MPSMPPPETPNDHAPDRPRARVVHLLGRLGREETEVKETYSIKTYINWQALHARFDVLTYEAGRAVGRTLEAAKHDPEYSADAIEINFSIGPPPPRLPMPSAETNK